MLFKLIKRFGRRVIYFFQWDVWMQKSWAQEGEDRILARIFEGKRTGFYIDIGAHHPKRFSNTYYFYSMGWKGINIDAMPGSMKLFNRQRARDINIEIGVARESGEMEYFIFNESALNGFDKELANHRHRITKEYRIIDTKKIEVQPLSYILEKYLPEGQIVDFMSVDVEGLDIEVLKSNDWSKYKPNYVLTEILNSELSTLANSEVVKYMEDINYYLFAKSVNTVIFKLRDIK